MTPRVVYLGPLRVQFRTTALSAVGLCVNGELTLHWLSYHVIYFRAFSDRRTLWVWANTCTLTRTDMHFQLHRHMEQEAPVPKSSMLCKFSSRSAPANHGAFYWPFTVNCIFPRTDPAETTPCTFLSDSLLTVFITYTDKPACKLGVLGVPSGRPLLWRQRAEDAGSKASSWNLFHRDQPCCL